MLHEYLNAAVALTQQHDSRTLAECLIETLRRFCSAKEIILYNISNTHNDLEFNESNIHNAVVWNALDDSGKMGRMIREFQGLLRCVQTQKMVVTDSEREGYRNLVLPIYGSRYLMGLLAIEEVAADEFDVEIVAKFLQIYAHLGILLNRNEHDALTGLLNRESFDRRMKSMLQSIGDSDRRSPLPSGAYAKCFAILDIDHFKKVNDQFGHLYGDEVLLLFSRLMTRTFRHGDLLFRYGGEEFAVVLINIDIETALGVLDRFRQVVAEYDFPQIGKLSVSIGVTIMEESDAMATVIDQADKALYFAKQTGRNRVYSYEKLVADGRLTRSEIRAGDIELF